MADPSAAGSAQHIARLEAEKRRLFEEAQREADAVFAQYQLSQLLASGGTTDELGGAILAELVRLTGAASGWLWVARSEGGGFGPAPLAVDAAPGADGAGPRGGLPSPDVGPIREWAGSMRGARDLVLEDDLPIAMIVLAPVGDDELDEEGLRVLHLARHELAVALRASLLRGDLERERQELSAIVEGATDAIVQVDADLLVVRLNGAAERLLGRSASACQGLPCHEALGCELSGGHAPADCPLAEVLASGRAIAYRESAVRAADGNPVRVAGGYSRSQGPDGAARATAILRDIRAAKALEELREGFVATVSHELRTPLALIKGYADTLLHFRLEPDAQREYVERIELATERLTALVTQILDIAHLDADPLVLERRPVRLEALLARLRGDLAVSRSAERLSLEIPADLPPLDVDAGRAGQILDNLVSNALKYTPDGSPVTISARRDGDLVAIAVADEGIGIPADDASLVFEPFHRARNVRETNMPGTGLGLHIARRLVEAHGGTLRLERRDDAAGTRAVFTLPLVAGERRTTVAAGADVGPGRPAR